MVDWDGRGLPPVAAERARRAAEGGAWTSLLSAPAAAGLEVAGFDPVGEVMGSMVQRIGWIGYQGCGLYGLGASRWSGAAGATTFSGYAPYADAVIRGYRTAMERMIQEASTIGADGVVGVRLSLSELDGSAKEFTALGTAVRARSRTRPGRIFTTDLPGQDVAKLVLAGWMPADLVFGIAVAIRHDDWQTRQQASSWMSGNTEVSGYTELVTHTRSGARLRFAEHVKRSGADGAIVSSMGLRVWSIEPSDNHVDHAAEASVFGTALARLHAAPAAPTRSLTFLPLK